MNNKNPIILPAIFKFEKWLEIRNRKINAGVFIPNRNSNPNIILLESALYQLRSFEISGWYTNEVGYQRGSHRIKKLYDLCQRGEVDLIICYSKEDIKGWKDDPENKELGINKSCTALYCIKECILIKDNEEISIS